MKQTVKLVLPAFIILSLAGLVILVVIYYRTTSTREVTFTEDKDIGVKVEGLNYSNTRDGRTIWRLRAKEATSFKSKKLMVLKGINLLFYPNNGEIVTMKAHDGTFNEANKVIFAKGNVVVSSEKGFTLKTDRLLYDSASGRITSDEPVTITQGAMMVHGVGFKADVDSGNISILKKVRAVISVKGIDR